MPAQYEKLKAIRQQALQEAIQKRRGRCFEIFNNSEESRQLELVADKPRRAAAVSPV